jgi:predicted RNA-binding Zn ribbon-like protein
MAEGVGIDRPIGELLISVTASMAAGSWNRLKICANDACQEAFYDTSRNRSGRWCSMAKCGNRMKGRAYRFRHSDDSASSAAGDGQGRERAEAAS